MWSEVLMYVLQLMLYMGQGQNKVNVNTCRPTMNGTLNA